MDLPTKSKSPVVHPTMTADAQSVVRQLLTLAIDIDVLEGLFGEQVGLHPTDVRALRLLHASGRAMPAGELGSGLDLSSGSTTHLIDRLERSGYVERVRDPGDRRRVLLQPSQKARTLAEAFFGAVEQGTAAALATASSDELAVMRRMLARLAAALRTDDRREDGEAP